MTTYQGTSLFPLGINHNLPNQLIQNDCNNLNQLNLENGTNLRLSSLKMSSKFASMSLRSSSSKCFCLYLSVLKKKKNLRNFHINWKKWNPVKIKKKMKLYLNICLIMDKASSSSSLWDGLAILFLGRSSRNDAWDDIGFIGLFIC